MPRDGEARSLCGLVLTRSGLSRGCVNVKGERIESVTMAPKYRVEARDYTIVPAAIDMHVHLRGLALSYKSTVLSGTAAAAAGGVSIIADMPNTVPEINSVETVRVRLEELRQEAIVDYTFYVGVPDDGREAYDLAKLPIAGFKVFPEDYDKETLCEVLHAASLYGKLIVVHAEHPYLVKIETGWDRNVHRSCMVELAAVRDIRERAIECKAAPKIHITHVSCSDTVRLARRYGFTIDTTPNHIMQALALMRVEIVEPCMVKVNPPLKGLIESSRLLNMLIEGFIDAIASDHAPHAVWEKTTHPTLCPPGITSLSNWAPWILTLSLTVDIPQLYVERAVEGPAKLLGLKRRGCMEAGCYADIVLYDTSELARFTPQGSRHEPLLSKLMEAAFQPVRLYIRGTPVYDRDDGILVEPGFGRNVLS